MRRSILILFLATPVLSQEPRFYTTEWEQRVDLAKQQGKPIIYWVDTTPNETADAEVFFKTFPEAVHILVNEHPSFKGKTKGVVFHAKDGYDYWIQPDDINAKAADKVRLVWVGEKKILNKTKVLQTIIPIQGDTVMTLDGYLARGGRISGQWCKEAGFDDEETAFIVSLQQQQQTQPPQQMMPQFNKTPQPQYQQMMPQRIPIRASGRTPIGGA